mmetsp:Transcript_119477/g.338114  ORF Transcript_119477/g.338114 Transcript_119477/m.338114 type:complete len:304 (+) Transcript_119477:485-1396(+)
MLFRLRLLVVTKDSDGSIGVVVKLEELVLRVRVLFRHIELVELLLQRERRVVSPEDLGGQVIHELLEILIDHARVDLVENLLLWLLAHHEGIDSFHDFLGHRHRVLVAYGILAQKVKMNLVWLFQFEVLHAQGAAANGVGLFFSVFFATNSKRELVDEVRHRRLLAVDKAFTLKQLLVARTNVPDHSNESLRAVVLQQVRLALEPTRRSKADVLYVVPIFAVTDVVVKRRDPLDVLLVHDIFPRVPWHVQRLRHACLAADVDDDVLWESSRLHHALLRVLTTATEKRRWLHFDSPQLLADAID